MVLKIGWLIFFCSFNYPFKKERILVAFLIKEKIVIELEINLFGIISAFVQFIVNLHTVY